MSSNSELLVLSNLKLISLLKIYEKLNTKYEARIEPNTYWTQFLRTIFQNDDREKALLFLQKTIYDSESIIKNLICNSKDLHTDIYLKEIIEDYVLSQIGIQNLAETYKEDHHYVCQLKCLLRNCNKFISEDIPEM